MRICIMRHGETEWNSLGKIQGRDDIPLNSIGKKQMNDAADYLKTYSWDIIICSPLLRARGSAEIISEKTGGVKILEEPDFMERHYGEASGLTVDEAKVRFPDDVWPGSEPKDALEKRAIRAWQKHTREQDGKNIIVISHGGIISSLLPQLVSEGLGPEKARLKNACMSFLEKTGDEYKIIFYNKTTDELSNS